MPVAFAYYNEIKEIERCCLKCKRKFFASSPFIRLCDWCKKLPIFSS